MSKNLFLLCLLFLVACRKGDDVAVVTVEATRPTPTPTIPTAQPTNTPQSSATPRIPTATPTPEPKTDLVVCTVNEPDSLFGVTEGYDHHVFHAFYENLYTNLSYEYQAHGLVALPSLADGSARLVEVEVELGDTVVDIGGEVRTLVNGVVLWHPAGDPITFTGNPTTTYQIEADFTFKPLMWEDGQPVTADDSVYAFELASNPRLEGGGQSELVSRTANYTALDEMTTRWVGLPGWRDATYFTNVFRPLPRHAWGHMSVNELLESDIVNHFPLSNGPFRVVSWEIGSHILLERNPYYYRLSEGYPRVESVKLVFPEYYGEAFLRTWSGDCDLNTADSSLSDYGGVALQWDSVMDALTLYSQPTPIWEYLVFGVNVIDENSDIQPTWFADTRVRQAVMLCLDRQAIVDNVVQPRRMQADAYILPDHPLVPADGLVWGYDPAGGNALLDEIGYLDQDGDGVREDPMTGQPFAINFLLLSVSASNQQIAQIVQEQLADCGLDVSVTTGGTNPFYNDTMLAKAGEFGLTYVVDRFAFEPQCQTFLSDSELLVGQFRWQNTEFDTVCRLALASLPGLPDYVSNHQEALRIFMEELPVIPLSTWQKHMFARHYVKNVRLAPSQPSVLWNVYELEIVPAGVEE